MWAGFFQFPDLQPNSFVKISVGINSFKVNNETTKTMYVICSKLMIKTPERRQSGAFIVNFEQVSHSFGVSIVDFEQVSAG